MPQQVLISADDPESMSVIEFGCGCVDIIVPVFGLNTSGLPNTVIIFQKVSIKACSRCIFTDVIDQNLFENLDSNLEGFR